jgi:hypothetical protein
VSLLAWMLTSDQMMHNFGDAEEQVLRQAKEQMGTNSSANGLAYPRHRHGEASFPICRPGEWPVCPRPNGRAHIVCGRPDDSPRYSRESFCPYTPAMSGDNRQV